MRGMLAAGLSCSLALVMAACVADSDDPEPVREADLPEFPPADFICNEDDVPSAFEYEVLTSGETSNEEAAALSADPERRAEQFEEWARVDGQFAAFSSEATASDTEGIAYFECAIDRYEHQSGAARAFDAVAASLDERVRITLSAQAFAEVTTEEIPSPQIGDETQAVSGTAVKDEQPFQFFAVTFRRYNMIGYSLSAAPEKFSFVEDAANITALMVRLLDERVEEFEEEREGD